MLTEQPRKEQLVSGANAMLNDHPFGHEPVVPYRPKFGVGWDWYSDRRDVRRGMPCPVRLGRLEVLETDCGIQPHIQWSEFFGLVQEVLGGYGVDHLGAMAVSYGRKEGRSN